MKWVTLPLVNKADHRVNACQIEAYFPINDSQTRINLVSGATYLVDLPYESVMKIVEASK